MSTLILLLYALHSLAGIAYEVVWIKLLTASIGMTVTAFGVVLATFMAGLGLGSYVIARWKGTSEASHGSRATYRLVALLQTLMGLLGIAFPLFLNWGDHLYVLVAPETEGLRHLLVRGLYVGLLLLPVTTLHGMNFPVLASLLTRCFTRSRTTQPGLLYCVGLLASGLGAFASLALIPALGLQGTSLALGMTNLILAMAAFLAGNRVPGHTQSMREETSSLRKRGSRDAAAPTPLSLSVLQTLGAVVGFLVISLEIIGAQYVWLIVNVTAYAEGILLTTVLLMMGLGSGLYLVLRERVRERSVPFMWGLFIALIAQLSVLPLAGDIASLFDRTLQELRPHELTTMQFLLGDALLALTILGVPMFGLGMSFCSLCDLATSPLPGQPQKAVISPLGRLYAWHNWGALIGAVLTTFGFLILLGLTHTWLLLSTCLVGTLALLVWRLPLSSAKGKPGQLPAGIPGLWGKGLAFLFLLGVLAWLATDADLTFRHAAAGDSQRVLYHREDALGVTEVYEDKATLARKLLTSRLRQEGGSAPKEIRVQRIQGYLPLFLHPDPRRVLMVGLGTGITLSPTLREEVEEVTVIEISHGVIEAAKRFFAQANARVLEHPKVRIIEQDGRNFIKLTRNAYDLIVQELFFPYQTGVGSLYTREHYRQCRAKLAPGGLMAQWITINQLNTNDLRTLVRTFQSVFPTTSLWLNGGYLLILGGLDPLHVPLQRFLERYETDDPLGGMPGLDSDPYNLLGLFVSHGQALREWTRDAPLNTDDNRFIEYSTPLAFNTLNTVTLAAETLTSLLSHFRPLTDVVYIDPFANDDSLDRLARVSTASQLLMKGIVARAEHRTEEAVELYAQAWELQPSNYQTRTFLEQTWAAKGHALILEEQYSAAIPWLQKALAVNARNLNMRFDLALCRSRQGDNRAAADLYESIIRLEPGWTQIASVWFNLGLTRYQMGLYQSAAALFREVLAHEPTSIAARFNLANSLAQSGDYQEAVTHYQGLLKIDPGHQDARANLKEILAWLERSDDGKHDASPARTPPTERR